MTERHESAGYLDAIFVSIRAFAQELEASRRWLARAEQTEHQAWRLSFLRASRASFERAPARLAGLVDRLSALGAAEALPAPLDRVRDNVAAMRADLVTHGERLRAAEAKETPIGRA